MSNRKILYQSKTKFNDLLVVQESNLITLYSPSTIRQTAVDADNSAISHLEYTQNILSGLVFTQNPETILVLGLGGGAIPMMLINVNRLFSIDIVEIDPEVASIAQKYFRFKTTQKIRLFLEDAYQFIKNSEKKYDIIIMDAYIGNDLPQSLSTLEFFKQTDSHLSNNGILIANLMTTNRPYYENMIKTISSVFHELWLLAGNTSSNTIVFAMNRKLSRREIVCNTLLIKKHFPYHFPLIRLFLKIQKLKRK